MPRSVSGGGGGRRARLTGAVVLVLLAAGCGGGGERSTSTAPTSSAVHETAGTVPGPGPATSELVKASASLQVPVGRPGGRSVVSWGKVTDGAVVAVVRNMAEQATGLAVAARRRGETGAVGPPAPVVPSLLNPGEWGVALVLLEEPAPGRLELEFEVGTVPLPERRADLAVQSAEGRDGGVAGTVGNPAPRRVGDVVVDVVCFSPGARPLTMARLRPASVLEPGASASFSATIRGVPCSNWAAVAWGTPGR